MSRKPVALVAIFLLACCSHAASNEKSLLAQVCQPSKSAEAPIFTSPQQLRKLIEEHAKASQDGTCDSRFNESFEELGALLDAERLKDICSPQMYQLIRAYHTKFVHYYLPESTRDELLEEKKHAVDRYKIGSAIPEAVRNFFILFVKQVGATCKQHLVSVLQKSPLLTNDDFAVLERYNQESRRLGFLYDLTKLGISSYGRNKADEFNSLQIVDLLGARVADATLDEGAKLYVQVRFDDRLKRIKDACQKRFMPVYMELFAPVVRLNNLGYIDRTKSTLENKELNENESIKRWFLIIQACEVLKDIEVLHDSSAMSAIVGIIQDNSHLGSRDAQHQAKLRQVKILSPEQARQLRERVEQSSDEVRPSYDPDLIVMEHEPVPFTPRMWLSRPKEVERELEHFQKDIDHYVWQRTSKLKEWRNNAKMIIKEFYYKHRNQIADRDQSSTLGQLTLFFERHRLVLLGVSMMLNIIFISTMMAG